MRDKTPPIKPVEMTQWESDNIPPANINDCNVVSVFSIKPTITYEIVGNTENVTPDFLGMWTCPRCMDKHVIGSAHACKPVLSKTEPEDDPTLTQQEVDEIAERLKIQRRNAMVTLMMLGEGK